MNVIGTGSGEVRGYSRIGSHIWSAIVAVCVMLSGLGALGQDSCADQWSLMGTLPGVNGRVNALAWWNPGGAGPQVVVAGGSFTVAGTVAARNIAVWNASTGVWAPLGNGPSGEVRAILVMPSGELFAGGKFSSGGPTGGLARWTGSTWAAVGTGSPSGSIDGVYSLAALPNGDIAVGGKFTAVGGVTVNGIARWNSAGGVWTAFGAGFNPAAFGTPATVVSALAVLPNGDLVAGGKFLASGNVSTKYIARWTGTAWAALDTGFNGAVQALTVFPNGDMAACGAFTTAGGRAANHLARWNRTAWLDMGGGVGAGDLELPHAVAAMSNGDLVVGGSFTMAGGGGGMVSAQNVARWSGSGGGWSALGGGVDGDVLAIVGLPSGDVVPAGDFDLASSVVAGNVARWNNAAWSALSTGTGAPVDAIGVLANGDVVAGTIVSAAAGGWTYGVGRWNGARWVGLGAGMDGTIHVLAALPEGGLVAGGSFAMAGGVSAACIAKWDGAAWTALGTGMSGSLTLGNAAVNAVEVMPGGDLLVAGNFVRAGGAVCNGIARWENAAGAWSALGAGMSGPINALAVMSDGTVIAGGSFMTAGGASANNIARWDGLAWSPLSQGVNNAVNALAVRSGFELIVGGAFTTAGTTTARYLASWMQQDGAWSALSFGTGLSGPVRALAVFSNGDIAVGGDFVNVGNSMYNHLAHWNGAAWVRMGGGTNDVVEQFARLPNGDLMMRGAFTIAGNSVSAYAAGLSLGSNPARITRQPLPLTVCGGGGATFDIAVVGAAPRTYRWEIETLPTGSEMWQDLTDGPMAGSAAMAAGVHTQALTITNADAFIATRYRVTAQNMCGLQVSNPVNLVVCIGDYNCDGGVDGQDVEGFFVDWQNGSPRADVTSDGGVDGGDVAFFFERWERGC